MENQIVTMASKRFGTVRKIVESESVLYCGADIAKALGYTNSRKALAAHCRCVTKRYTPHPQSIDKELEMSFIPEADVYRLICHSKLPSALEFEKWVFEDVVPKAVDDKLNTEPKQPALETSEYYYFPKTFKGEPVITIADFEYFTGIQRHNIYKPLKTQCKLGEEYFSLSSAGIAQYKRENPSVSRLQSVALVLKESAVRKLLKYFKLSVEIPMIEETKQPDTKFKVKRTANEILDERKITRDDCIIALDVLRRIERNCENNVKMAEHEGRSTQFYGRSLSEVKNVIKGVGMLLVMGY